MLKSVDKLIVDIVVVVVNAASVEDCVVDVDGVFLVVVVPVVVVFGLSVVEEVCVVVLVVVVLAGVVVVEILLLVVGALVVVVVDVSVVEGLEGVVDVAGWGVIGVGATLGSNTQLSWVVSGFHCSGSKTKNCFVYLEGVI